MELVKSPSTPTQTQTHSTPPPFSSLSLRTFYRARFLSTGGYLLLAHKAIIMLCLITASGNGDCSHTAMWQFNCLFKCPKQRVTPQFSQSKKNQTVGYLRHPHVSCHTPTRGRNPPQEINGSPRGPNMLGLPAVSISHYQAFYTGSDRRHIGITLSQLCMPLFDKPRGSGSGRLCHNLNPNDHISVKSGFCSQQ